MRVNESVSILIAMTQMFKRFEMYRALKLIFRSSKHRVAYAFAEVLMVKRGNHTASQRHRKGIYMPFKWYFGCFYVCLGNEDLRMFIILELLKWRYGNRCDKIEVKRGGLK